MSNGTASALNSEQDLASIPMAQGGLARLARARAPKRRRADGACSWVCGMMPRADWLGSEVRFRGQAGKHLRSAGRPAGSRGCKSLAMKE
jgi:hypothetical protein